MLGPGPGGGGPSSVFSASGCRGAAPLPSRPAAGSLGGRGAGPNDAPRWWRRACPGLWSGLVLEGGVEAAGLPAAATAAPATPFPATRGVAGPEPRSRVSVCPARGWGPGSEGLAWPWWPRVALQEGLTGPRARGGRHRRLCREKRVVTLRAGTSCSDFRCTLHVCVGGGSAGPRHRSATAEGHPTTAQAVPSASLGVFPVPGTHSLAPTPFRLRNTRSLLPASPPSSPSSTKNPCQPSLVWL